MYSRIFPLNIFLEDRLVHVSKSQCLFPLLSLSLSLSLSLQALKSRDCRRCVICEPMHHDARALPRFIHAIAYEDTVVDNRSR